MPITPDNPFNGRHYSGEVILLAVRWYLRYPLAYGHVAEVLAERGLAVYASCIWRWVQAYAPELNKRCRPHLRPTNKSYRIDEDSVAGFSPPLPLRFPSHPQNPFSSSHVAASERRPNFCCKHRLS